MSLVEICKERILREMVEATRQVIGATGKQGAAFAAMIVDEVSLRVLSSSCKVYDVLDSGVTVVEMLTKQRQLLPQLDSIYFITPMKSSVESLIADFQNEKRPPHYKSVHLFFSNTIMHEKELLSLLAKAQGLLPRIKTFVDFNLNFIAYESRVFHLDQPDILLRCFPRLTDRDVLRQMACKLLTVCLTLGDKPLIRFAKDNDQHQRGLCEGVATILQEMLDGCNVERVSRGSNTLLILDRSVDASAILVHEYTYQALAYDVVDIPCCTPLSESMDKPSDQVFPDDSFEYDTTNNLGEKEVRTAVLGENDEVYQRYKHGHITVVGKKVMEDIKKFNRDNAAIQSVQQKGVSSKAASQAVRQLPQYTQMLAKYYIHVSLTEMCFAELTKQGVMKAGGIEQDLATGVDRKGKPVEAQKVLGQIGQLLGDPTVGSVEKMRLLLLYFINMNGVKQEDIRKMVGAASLSLTMTNQINAFLDLNISSVTTEAVGQREIAHDHKFAQNKEKLQYFQRRAKTADFELSRYDCGVKELMEQLVAGNLHGGLYPFVEEAGRPARGRGGFGFGGDAGAGDTRSANVRARQKDWDWGTEAAEETSQKPSKSTATGKDALLGVGKGGKGKFIVFVIGGITMAEMRCVYEVSRQTGTDIYIGGTTILTPGGLFKMLKAKQSSAFAK